VALENYAALQTEVADWLNRKDLNAKVPTFIRVIEAEAERRLRTWQMERRSYAKTLVSATDGSASEYLPLPADYLQLIRARVMDAPTQQLPLSYASMDQIDVIQRNKPAGGIPTAYNISGRSLRLGPFPNATYTIEITYFAKIPRLSATETRNWLLQDHPDIYLFGALAAAESYLKNDERVGLWKTQKDDFISQLETANERAAKSGQPMRARFKPY
jgi:hypothetical protein